MRESRGARNLRSRIAQFEAEVNDGDIRAAIRLRDDLERLVMRLRQDLGLVPHSPISTTLSIGLPGVSVQFPGPSAPGIRSPQGRRVIDRIHRPWLVLLQDVFDALSSASSMGRLYEVLYPAAKDRAGTGEA